MENSQMFRAVGDFYMKPQWADFLFEKKNAVPTLHKSDQYKEWLNSKECLMRFWRSQISVVIL